MAFPKAEAGKVLSFHDQAKGKFSELGEGANSLFTKQREFEPSADLSFDLQDVFREEEQAVADMSDYRALRQKLQSLREISENNRDQFFSDLFFDLATLEPYIEGQIESIKDPAQQYAMRQELTKLQALRKSAQDTYEFYQTYDGDKYNRLDQQMDQRQKNMPAYLEVKQRQELLSPLRAEFGYDRINYNHAVKAEQTIHNQANLEEKWRLLQDSAKAYQEEFEIVFAEEQFDRKAYLPPVREFGEELPNISHADPLQPQYQNPLAGEYVSAAAWRERSLASNKQRQEFQEIQQAVQDIKNLAETRGRLTRAA